MMTMQLGCRSLGVIATLFSASAWTHPRSSMRPSLMPPLHLKCTGGTYLQASASQEGSDENNNIGRNDPAMEAFRETLESTYDRYNQLDAYQLHDDRYSTAHYLRSVADGESIKTDNWLDFCDEECEQCEIPEEYKTGVDDQAIDVMAFLGIRRAEPLRVDCQVEHHDWE